MKKFLVTQRVVANVTLHLDVTAAIPEEQIEKLAAEITEERFKHAFIDDDGDPRDAFGEVVVSDIEITGCDEAVSGAISTEREFVAQEVQRQEEDGR